MYNDMAFGSLLRRDRVVVLAGLVGVTAAAWAYTAYLAETMGRMDMEMVMPHMQAWGAVDLVLLLIMWAVMMVAMMVPSAAPMILMFARINRNRRDRGDLFVSTAVFLLGYLLVWAGFSVLATAAQWGLHAAALLSPAMASATPPPGRRYSAGGGPLPVDSAQARLPDAVPLPSGLPLDRVARGHAGGTSHGDPTRGLLRGVLLDADGAALRGGSDEPAVDRGDRGIRSTGENRPEGRVGKPSGGSASHGVGRVDGGDGPHLKNQRCPSLLVWRSQVISPLILLALPRR